MSKEEVKNQEKNEIYVENDYNTQRLIERIDTEKMYPDSNEKRIFARTDMSFEYRFDTTRSK